MINVVFLLLIFFLMTARIAPPEPFDVTPPESTAEDPAEGQTILYVDAEGQLALGEARGEAVYAALDGVDAAEVLLIRADKAVAAEKIAELLARLASAGIGQVKLVSEQR